MVYCFMPTQIKIEMYQQKVFFKALGLLAGIKTIINLIFIKYVFVKPKNSIFIDLIAVNANSRGKGLGRRLMQELKQITLNSDYRDISLNVVSENNIARNLYASEGFKEYNVTSFGFMGKLLGIEYKSYITMSVCLADKDC